MNHLPRLALVLVPCLALLPSCILLDAEVEIEEACGVRRSIEAADAVVGGVRARTRLLEGVDQLGYLLGASHDIAAYEASHPATVSTIA